MLEVKFSKLKIQNGLKQKENFCLPILLSPRPTHRPHFLEFKTVLGSYVSFCNFIYDLKIFKHWQDHVMYALLHIVLFHFRHPTNI